MIDARYSGLEETEQADSAVRTRLNVRDSEALLVLARGAITGGTALALEEAGRLGRPSLVQDLDGDPAGARAFLSHHGTVNVAGPRESEAPGAYASARALLLAALS